jgi:hypothetical protein
MHVAQLVESGGVTLVGGLAKPEQSLAVVLGDTNPIDIVKAQFELGLRVA